MNLIDRLCSNLRQFMQKKLLRRSGVWGDSKHRRICLHVKWACAPLQNFISGFVAILDLGLASDFSAKLSLQIIHGRLADMAEKNQGCKSDFTETSGFFFGAKMRDFPIGGAWFRITLGRSMSPIFFKPIPLLFTEKWRPYFWNSVPKGSVRVWNFRLVIQTRDPAVWTLR